MKLKSESPMQYRKYRLIAAVVLLSAGFAGKTLAAAPDPDFGVNGTVITSFIGPGAPNNIEAVALQPDGRIVVGGTALARFMADGALDTTFGQAGSVDVPYRIRGIAVQSDGRIVIVGETKEVSGAANLVVARFEADGTDDGAFGDQGRTVVDISGGRDQMNAIAVA
ncbi:MAG TPA: delta-60 repeat domain-containing protein, partial [Tichowtungia sp.]|nr:delta-60 repeat domain-containing protein [Tichowtungia sp.]